MATGETPCHNVFRTMNNLTPGQEWFNDTLCPALNRATENIKLEQGLKCSVSSQFRYGYFEAHVESSNRLGSWHLNGEFRLCEIGGEGYGCESQVNYKLPNDEAEHHGSLGADYHKGMRPEQLSAVIAHDFQLLATLVALGELERARGEAS